MSSVPDRLTLRILLIKEGSQWVAQCLEHDLAAQGPEIDDAIDAFVSILAATIVTDAEAGRQPLSRCRPAPAEYFDLVRRAKHLDRTPPRRLPDEVPPPWMRVLDPEVYVV